MTAKTKSKLNSENVAVMAHPGDREDGHFNQRRYKATPTMNDSKK